VSGTLLSAQELLLGATLIVLSLLVLVAERHIGLRQSLERLLGLGCLVLVGVHLQ
jgi:hypothetical protein